MHIFLWEGLPDFSSNVNLEVQIITDHLEELKSHASHKEKSDTNKKGGVCVCVMIDE